MKIIIAGGPKTGKSSAALELGGHIPTRATDAVVHLPWSEASEKISAWFDVEGPWVIEGVRVVHGLRKWLAAHPTGAPCDYVLSLVYPPFVGLTKKQRALGVGANTIFQGIRSDLVSRGVVCVDIHTPEFLEGVLEGFGAAPK